MARIAPLSGFLDESVSSTILCEGIQQTLNVRLHFGVTQSYRGPLLQNQSQFFCPNSVGIRFLLNAYHDCSQICPEFCRRRYGMSQDAIASNNSASPEIKK